MSRRIALLVLIATLAAAPAPPTPRRQAPPSSRSASTIRCPANRDVWLSAVDDEQSFNMGAARSIKLKVWQEFGLVDFDVAALRGRSIERAALYLKPTGRAKLGLNGGSDLHWLTVSTVSHDWVEGLSTRYGRDLRGHGATFLESSFEHENWGWEGARIWDVSLGNGRTLRTDGRLQAVRLQRDSEPWLRMEIDPRLVQALVAGASHGLLLMDGSTGVGVNSFIKSRESGEGPFLEVKVGDSDSSPPAAPSEVHLTPLANRATAESGALEVRLRLPEGAFAFDVRIAGRAVERWQIPFALDAADVQSFPIVDLPPDRSMRVEVAAVDAAGNRSPYAGATTTSSRRFRPPELPRLDSGSAGGPPPRLGGAKVWAFPEVTEVDPLTGRVLGGTVDSDPRRKNSVWDGATGTVRLIAARGEIVSFQLAIEGALAEVSVALSNLRGPGEIADRNVRLWRTWYVAGRPEYALPLVGSFQVPAADNNVPGQTLQAITVDLHIPPRSPAGEYRGSVTVASPDDQIELDLQLRVFDVVLPDEIHFNVELNTYAGPGRAGSPSFVDSFRLAHYHRATINRVPYTHRGAVHSDWVPRLDAQSRITDWSEFDHNLGGLLDGSWFVDNPRGPVPVPTLYLPFFEGWPRDFRKHYHPGPGIPLDAVDPIAKLRHDTLAPALLEALDPTFKQALQTTVREFVRHFQEKGWNRTRLQFYLNNKPQYGYTMWTLDEPFESLDWAAINAFARLFKSAVEDPAVYTAAWQQDLYSRGLEEMDRQRPVFLFRADVSRPMWQGSVSDGLINSMYVSSDALPYSRLLRGLKERMPTLLSTYGSANRVEENNWRSAAWCLEAFVHHADGVLPWQSLGGAEALSTPTQTALLIDAGPLGGAVASLRLHALRRGAQDAELLRLLQLETGWSRQQIGQMVAEALYPEGAHQSRDRALRSLESLSAAGFYRLKLGILSLLTRAREANPAAG